MTAFASDGEVFVVAGEPPGDDGARRWRRLDSYSVFGAALEHPADQRDVDDLVIEHAHARGVDTFGTPLLDES